MATNKPINILFINPPFKGRFSRTSRSPAIAKGGTLYYPIWLAYAAGVCEGAGHLVKLVDVPARDEDYAEIKKTFSNFSPHLIVVDTSTPSIYSDVEVAAALKNEFPDAFVVLVGTHPSALAKDTLELNKKIDAVALEEFDFTIRDLALAIQNKTPFKDVAGLVIRRGEEFIHTGIREKITDLDSLPFVASVYKKHLDVHDYFFAAASYPMLMIMTGRGCPHKCFFCVYPQVFHGRRYRVRSPENVVDEFSFIVDNFPQVKEIGIEDDCFTANPGRVKKICQLLIERKIKIKWYCNVRGDVDYELLKIMKEAGCRLVTVGFESGSQQVLDNINKGEKVESYLEFGRAARKADMLVHGCLMTGNPGDSKESLRQSYQFAKKINCDSMQFYPLYVYPGTEAYDWAQKKGYLKTENYAEWLTAEGMHNCVIDLPDLSSKEMVELCDKYLVKYHFRPAYLAKKLFQAICHPAEGLRSILSARVFLGKIVSRFSGKG